MSKETRDIIIAKLQKLDEYLGYLREIAKVSAGVFLKEPTLSGAAERYLQLSIEVLLDVGKLTIIEFELRRPENSHEILEILHESGRLNKKLFLRLQGMPGFRNILVHDYVKLDKARVFEFLGNNLNDFVAYKEVILQAVK